MTDRRRLACLEASQIDLLDRVLVLERAVAVEVTRRKALEQAFARLAGLPCRVDRLERAGVALRRGRTGS